MVRLKSVDNYTPSVGTVLLIFLLVIASLARGQENQADSVTIQAQEKMPLNTITVGIGTAVEINSGASFSNIGFDYLRRLNPKWELGVQFDIDWEKNFEQFEGIQVAGIVAYSITGKWPVFAGFGIAIEEVHNEGFFRVGTEYTFFLGKKGMFFIAPGTFFDFTTDDVTASIMLAFGVNW